MGLLCIDFWNSDFEASFDLSQIYWQPSGTLTAPNMETLLVTLSNMNMYEVAIHYLRNVGMSLWVD